MIKLKAEVHCEGIPGGIGKSIIKYRFVELYNKACELVNPHFEEWNEEFNNLYPGHVMSDEGDEIYNRFICTKCNEQIRSINDQLIKLFYDPEYGCTCTGIARNYPESKIYITLTQIE